MGDIQHDPHAGKFGAYLRSVRESRRLSLDAVEELATGYPDRITKSHLSRIENGRAEPTFRRLYALSQIYGIPVKTLAERFELDLDRERRRPEGGVHAPAVPGPDDIRERIREGRYLEALDAVEALLHAQDHGAEGAPAAREHLRLRIERVNCLLKLERVEIAKTEAEAILDAEEIDPRDRIRALYLLAACCIRTSRLTVGDLAIGQARVLADELPENDRLRADVSAMAAKLRYSLEQTEDAATLFTAAVEGYRASACRLEEVRAQRNLAEVLVARNQLGAAKRKLLELVRTCETERFDRQLALALGTLGVVAWREDAVDVAESYCLRSNAIAREREYLSLVFQNCYYLWRIAARRGDAHGEAVNLRTLRAYVSRVDHGLGERSAFLAAISEDAS